MGRMENTSAGLRVWNEKLSEILKLAGELQNEDQKFAAESWCLAVHHIQSLWGNAFLSTATKSVLAQIKEEGDSSEAQTTHTPQHLIDVLGQVKEEGDSFEAASSLVWKRSTQQMQAPTPKKKVVKEKHSNGEEDVERPMKHRHEGKKSSKSLVKQEAQPVQESDSQDQSQDAGKVQSVHLMISADPVLVPSMSRFKKVFKNEGTGKVETTYQCEKCPKQCRTAIALYKHWSSHSKTLECPICHQRLCNRHALNAHKRTHTGERPFECTKCSSRFTTRGNLARHIASHDGKKPWQCALCGKRYTEKKSLKVHMRTHTGEKPYACTVCPKKFSQSGILQAHMLIHSNQFAHLCDVCGRSFRQRSQLATHHLRHQGVRPFSCSSCDRSFTTKGDMERHLRTHTGERPFSCDVCGSSFARPQTLQEHKNRHYNFKPYVCKICGKRFHEMAACSRHIKGLHSREKGSTPASANILRLTNPEHQQDEEGKQSILITHLDVADAESKEGDVSPASPQGDVEGNEEEEEEEMEGVDEDDREEVKHHIFVMHTTEPEETQLITIAEPTSSDGEGHSSTEVSCEDCVTLMSSVGVLRNHARHCTVVSCEDCRTLVSSVDVVRSHIRHCKNHQSLSIAEWLMEDGALNQDSNSSNGRNSDDDGEGGGGSDESDDGGAGDHEVVASDLDHHTVTISEDVTITSLPLTQLPPIHLQLESDYMVVLREPASSGQALDRRLPQQQVEEHSLVEAEEENSQQRLSLVSSLLNE